MDDGMFAKIAMFCMLELQYSETAKTPAATTASDGCFLPKKTAASAVHPLPPDMPGTKDESLMQYVHPQKDAAREAITQERLLNFSGLIPCERSTSESEPQILRHNPSDVFFKIKISSREKRMQKIVVMIFACTTGNEKSAE